MDIPRNCFSVPGNGGVFSYVFPETQSAIVVLTNGATSADASDFVAKMLIQALFNLQPHVDLFPLMKAEAKAHQRWFEDLVRDWREHRDVSQPEAPRAQYIGDYTGPGITLNIAQRAEDLRLVMTFNGKKRTLCTLEYYNKDTYSFLPTERDRWLKDGMLDYDCYKVGLLEFRRNCAGDVDGLSWQYDRWEKEAWFGKASSRINSPEHVTTTTPKTARMEEEAAEAAAEAEAAAAEAAAAAVAAAEASVIKNITDAAGGKTDQTGMTLGWRDRFKKFFGF
jgi:hypothetical protein